MVAYSQMLQRKKAQTMRISEHFKMKAKMSQQAAVHRPEQTQCLLQLKQSKACRHVDVPLVLDNSAR